MTDYARYSYMSLLNILPSVISNQIFVVYTNCESEFRRPFDHKTLNKTFGFNDDKFIPCVHIENPFVAILQAR